VATLCDLSRYEEARDVFAKMQALIHQHSKQPDLVMGRLANQHAESGYLYEDSSMFADAIQEYRRALSLYSAMPDVQLRLAKLLIKTGQLEKARSELEDIVAKEPSLTDARNYLGLLYYKLGRLDLAKAQWENSQKSLPNDLTSKAYLAISAQIEQSSTQSRP